MNFFKKHNRKIKWASAITITSGTIWIFVQIRKTRRILDNAVDTSIIDILEPPQRLINNRNNEFQIPNWIENDDVNENSVSMWNSLKFVFARRLLNLTNSDNTFIRSRAIKHLASLKNLEKWQYLLIGNMCDATTCVGLARIKGVNSQLFVQPPLKYFDHDHHMLVNEMKIYLTELDKQSDHSCLTKFINQAFAEESHKIIDQELSSSELSKLINQANDIFISCLEAILHHTEIEEFAKDIVIKNGLYLLMEIYNRHKNDLIVTIILSRIFSNISVFPELLIDIHKSGWLGVISEWLYHDDVRVSLPASCALTNLDINSNYKYDKQLFPMHPVFQNNEKVEVDVVFVHGLLGGVFFTWRQRDRYEPVLSLMGKKGGNASITNDDLSENESVLSNSSDPTTREYIETINVLKQEEWDDLGDDYEIICFDTPTFTNELAKGPYTCDIKELPQDDYSTKCWPKDWLAHDCAHLRIIGVNYETSISTWTAFCPYLHKKRTLDERSNEITLQLLKAGIGNRPIVWVTHSMGGLLVKNILSKAQKSHDRRLQNLCKQTKGIVFYSTPHFGTKVAILNPATSLILWPSVELQELRQDSPSLLQLHKEFLKIAKYVPLKVISFVETKPTIFTALKLNFLLVEPISGNPQIGEYYEIPQDHLGICKPANRYSFLYQKVLHLIKETKENNEESNKLYFINNLLKYYR